MASLFDQNASLEGRFSMFKPNKQRLQELKDLVENHDIFAGSFFGDQWDITEDFEWLIKKAQIALEDNK